MYSAAFIYVAGDYDDEFHALNDKINEVAKSLPGFIGKETWESATDRKSNSTYYWKDEATLKEFSRHPRHLEAKRQYARWYEGYHIVIAKVIRSYGDDGFPHFTPNDRAEQR